jgi:Arc/MetJ-type ribon-helix-helix transcriptional regulator
VVLWIEKEYHIMTIELSKDLEQIVNDAVLSGQYAGQQDVIRDALTRLRQTIPAPATKPARKARSSRQTAPKQAPLSPDELNQQLLAAGLILQLPDPAQDIDDDEPPVEIMGEPLSETIIRERR